MKHKVLVYSLVISLLLTYPSPVLAQFPDLGQIASKLKRGSVSTESASTTEEEVYKKFTCPSCERDFEVRIDPGDIELKKGVKKIVCPYDGTEFYPKSFVDHKEKLQYENIRCPSCGKEFKAHIDVQGILAGRPQVLICPYDKKKFYFKAEGFKPSALRRANLMTVICPTDRKTFRAYINFDDPKELVCPYDGTSFFPAPDLIIPQDPMSDAGLGGLGNVGGLGVAGQISDDGAMQTTFMTDRPSRIEDMFSKHIPLSVSKVIKQFGYNIFKPIKVVEQRSKVERDERSTTKENTSETRLLRSMIDSRKQKGVLPSQMQSGVESEFISPASMPELSSYVLGPGDSLKITIWGQIQQIFPISVDSEGKVLLPKVGPLFLWGLKFSEAEKLIRKKIVRSLRQYTGRRFYGEITKHQGVCAGRS